jgi:biotin carboxyl carrier protein
VKYRIRFPGETSSGRPLEVAAGAPAFEVALGESRFEGSALEVQPGLWSLVGRDGRQVEVSVARGADGSVRAAAGGYHIAFELLDELTARALAATGGRSSRRVDHVAAAMPGRVLKVMVGPGDGIQAGQPLLVLEAMKMENEVKSPRDGTIDSVDCVAGGAVSTGDVLVRFRPES